MSKKQPEIKVIYPDASAAAMLLTDAMIRRSTGKRVVETNSEEREYTGEQLFGGVLSTKTDTSVELTLRLNPDAMDYALTMLVAKNLTEEEKRAIRMETDSMEIVDLLSAHAAGAAGASTCTEKVGSASRADGDVDAIEVPLLEAPKEEATPPFGQSAATRADKKIEIGKISTLELGDILSDFARGIRSGEEENTCVIRAVNSIVDRIKQEAPAEEKIEIGKIPDKELRNILTDMIVSMDEGTETADAIDTAIKEIDHHAGVIEGESIQIIQEDTILLDKLSILICGAMRVNNKKITELKTFASNVAHYLNNGSTDNERVFVVTARDLADALFSVQHDFTKDPVRTLDAEMLIRKNNRIDEVRSASHACDKMDETDEANGEIDAGLLNDIDAEGSEE